MNPPCSLLSANTIHSTVPVPVLTEVNILDASILHHQHETMRHESWERGLCERLTGGPSIELVHQRWETEHITHQH
eukprot:COSAG02_NODE_34869_length_477_cov_0.806878_1_plen_75_part_10